MERYGIAYHEKTLGQLFCDGSAQQIIDLLLAEMKQAKAELRLATSVANVEKTESGFLLTLSSEAEQVQCQSLVDDGCKYTAILQGNRNEAGSGLDVNAPDASSASTRSSFNRSSIAARLKPDAHPQEMAQIKTKSG